MHPTGPVAAGVWTIVLAAGSGRRLAALTDGVPKQFWSPNGTRSLLDDTLLRLTPIASPRHSVVVVDRAHHRYLDQTTARRPGIRVLFQPEDRGTAAGVLLGLTPVLEATSDAAVVVTPSDHAVGDIRQFRRDVLRAVAHLDGQPDAIVLFGVEPSTPNEDYGWITPEPGSTAGLRAVASFVEKPSRDIAERLMVSGALWNTMVVVARAETLFDLYWRHLPGLAAVFDEALQVPPPDRDAFLALQYPELPALDFSRHLLAQATGLQACAWPQSMGWSDLGTPQRLEGWLAANTAAGRLRERRAARATRASTCCPA